MHEEMRSSARGHVCAGADLTMVKILLRPATPQISSLSRLDSGGAMHPPTPPDCAASAEPEAPQKGPGHGLRKYLRTRSLTSTSATLVLGEPQSEGTYPRSIAMETKIRVWSHVFCSLYGNLGNRRPRIGRRGWRIKMVSVSGCCVGGCGVRDPGQQDAWVCIVHPHPHLLENTGRQAYCFLAISYSRTFWN